MAKTNGTSAARSKKDALIDDLSIQVTKLAKQVKAAEKERDALRQKLDKQKSRAQEALRAVQKKARKELKRARSTVEPTVASTVERDGPDETWTVTRLRAEARTRGVAGYSRMTKAQLITVLG